MLINNSPKIRIAQDFAFIPLKPCAILVCIYRHIYTILYLPTKSDIEVVTKLIMYPITHSLIPTQDRTMIYLLSIFSRMSFISSSLNPSILKTIA